MVSLKNSGRVRTDDRPICVHAQFAKQQYLHGQHFSHTAAVRRGIHHQHRAAFKSRRERRCFGAQFLHGAREVSKARIVVKRDGFAKRDQLHAAGLSLAGQNRPGEAEID